MKEKMEKKGKRLHGGRRGQKRVACFTAFHIREKVGEFSR